MLAVMPRDSNNGVEEARAFLEHVQTTYPETAGHWQPLGSEEDFEDAINDEDYASYGSQAGFSFGIVFSSGSPDFEYKVFCRPTCSCFKDLPEQQFHQQHTDEKLRGNPCKRAEKKSKAMKNQLPIIVDNNQSPRSHKTDYYNTGVVRPVCASCLIIPDCSSCRSHLRAARLEADVV